MVFKAGNTPWNKGKYHSDATKQKMSENNVGMKGKHHTEETKRKIGKSNAGKKHSEETKQKIREHSNPFWKGKKQWAGKKHPMFGRHYSEESKEKNRRSHIGMTAGEKNPMWGKTSRMKGKHHTEEAKWSISIAHKKLWQNEVFAKRRIASFQTKPNGLEIYLDFLLQNNFPDEWKFVGDGQEIIDGLCPDFINCNDKRQIIEVFGDYWHNRKNMRHHQTEQGRKEAFAKHGYTTLIIWEHELADENKLIEKIKKFV